MCVLFCCGSACVWCVVLGTLSLSLSCSLSFLFSFPYFFSHIFIFLSSFSFSFSLAPSLTLALEAFECDLVQSKCTAIGSLPPPLPFLLPSPPPLLKKKKRELFITGIFPARNLFFITVLNKFQKIVAGVNYSHYTFILIPKQKGCNCNHFAKDGIALLPEVVLASAPVPICSKM